MLVLSIIEYVLLLFPLKLFYPILLYQTLIWKWIFLSLTRTFKWYNRTESFAHFLSIYKAISNTVYNMSLPEEAQGLILSYKRWPNVNSQHPPVCLYLHMFTVVFLVAFRCIWLCVSHHYAKVKRSYKYCAFLTGWREYFWWWILSYLSVLAPWPVWFRHLKIYYLKTVLCIPDTLQISMWVCRSHSWSWFYPHPSDLICPPPPCSVPQWNQIHRSDIIFVIEEDFSSG